MNQEMMNFVPKYYRVKQILINEIKEGKYTANVPIPSNEEMTRKFGIGHETAKRVRMELINEGLVYTVPGQGCFVSGSRQDSAAAGKNTNNKSIVYISPTDSDDTFYHGVFVGVLRVIQSKGYRLEVYNSEWDYSKETQILGQCLADPPAGLIFSPNFYEADYRHLFELQKRGVRVVLLGKQIKNYDIDWVGIESIAGIRRATSYLIKSGHRKIVFLGCHKNDQISVIFEGYEQALEEKGITVNPNLILDADIEIDGIGESGHVSLKRFLSGGTRFSAIVAINEDLTLGAYRLLKEKGLKVPEDVSLLGLVNQNIAENFEVPLTTIVFDTDSVGVSAAKLILNRIDSKLFRKPELNGSANPRKLFIKTHLIINKSTRKIG